MPKGTYAKGRIEVPEHDLIKCQAEQAVRNTLDAVRRRPHDRAKKAAEIIRQADAELATHVNCRNTAAASLWFYERVLGLAFILGVNPNAYREILAKALTGDPKGRLPNSLGIEELARLAAKAGVPKIEDAAQKLPELSRIVAAARARRQAAMPFLQDAALALHVGRQEDRCPHRRQSEGDPAVLGNRPPPPGQRTRSIVLH